MAVAFDAKTATVTSVNGVATLTVSNLTVGSGSNRALIVQLWFSNLIVPAGLTVTWDSGGTNQAMSAIAGTTTGTNAVLSGASVLYGLVAPTSGNKNLVVSWTGNLEAHATAVSFTGVDQTGGATSFANGNITNVTTLTAGPISITTTSATGNMVVCAFSQNQNNFTANTGTQIAVDNASGPNLAVISSYTNGAASVTSTATFAGTSAQIASSVDVVAASSGAAPFAQYDWSKGDFQSPSKPMDFIARYGDFYPNPIPFAKYQWEAERDIIGAPPQAQPYNINLLANPLPFSKADWGQVRSVSDWLPFVAYPNLALNVVIVQSPFAQYDWSKPQRGILSPQSATLQNNNLSLMPLTVYTLMPQIWL